MLNQKRIAFSSGAARMAGMLALVTYLVANSVELMESTSGTARSVDRLYTLSLWPVCTLMIRDGGRYA